MHCMFLRIKVPVSLEVHQHLLHNCLHFGYFGANTVFDGRIEARLFSFVWTRSGSGHGLMDFLMVVELYGKLILHSNGITIAWMCVDQLLSSPQKKINLSVVSRPLDLALETNR